MLSIPVGDPQEFVELKNVLFADDGVFYAQSDIFDQAVILMLNISARLVGNRLNALKV